MPDFDPYHRWLGISPDERPISKYRLLGIAEFEQDKEIINSASLRQTKHLRTMQAGEHESLVAQLLNEISSARVTLLDPEQKSAYDAQLRIERTPKEAQPTPAAAPIVQTAAPAVSLTTRKQPAFGTLPKTRKWRGRNPILSRKTLIGLTIVGVATSAGFFLNMRESVDNSAPTRLTRLGNLEIPLKTALYAHYSLDNTTEDSSGNDRHGVLSDPTKIKPAVDRFGNPDSAYEIQPRASIDVSPANSLRPHANSGHVTYSMWLKPSGDGIVLNQYRNFDVGESHFFLAVSPDSLVITGRGTKAYNPSLTTAMNEWHHYVIGYHGQTGDVEVWADGIFVGSDNIELNPSSSSNQPFRIGFLPNAGANDDQTMIVDDVSIFNRHLIEAEVVELYRRGLP